LTVSVQRAGHEGGEIRGKDPLKGALEIAKAEE